MTPMILAILLLLSVVGTLLSALVSFMGGGKAHRSGQLLLGLSACAGLVASVVVAISDPATNLTNVILPDSLFSQASDPNFVSPAWPLFYDMVLGLDRFSAIFYALLSAVTVLVATYAIPYLGHTGEGYSLRTLNILTALFVFGMQGVILSSNIIGFMAFWEIMSVTSFFLILSSGSEVSRKAGFLYLVMTHLSGGMIMAGLFLLSGGALLSDFSVLALVTSQLTNFSLQAALVLLLFGFSSQMGLVPFHVWVPNAHSQSPSHGSALMSGVMLNVALYGFLRVLLFILPSVPLWFILATLIMGGLSAVSGVLYASQELDIKRVLADSSIYHFGVMFLMLGLGLLAGQEGQVALTQTILYTVIFATIAHAVFKTGLFMVAGVISLAVHTRNLEHMGGLAQRMPQFSVMTCLLILAAAGLPPFAPFMAAWIFLQAVIDSLTTATPVLMIALVATLLTTSVAAGLSVFMMVKFYGLIFLGQSRAELGAEVNEPKPSFMLPILISTVLSLLLGVFAPTVLHELGALNLVEFETRFPAVVVGDNQLAPLAWLTVMVGLVVLVLILRRILTKIKFERGDHTWGGGQPITPRMEYSATGFSAPIRFFFRFWLRPIKVMTATPLAPNNPWLASRGMSLNMSQIWYDKVYLPLGKGIERLAGLVSKLQNGNIQSYVSLILLTLFLTLIIAL